MNDLAREAADVARLGPDYYEGNMLRDFHVRVAAALAQQAQPLTDEMVEAAFAAHMRSKYGDDFEFHKGPTGSPLYSTFAAGMKSVQQSRVDEEECLVNAGKCDGQCYEHEPQST